MYCLTIVSIMSSLGFLWCSSIDVLTAEGEGSNSNLLSFSFDKKNFNDFQCNFSESVLNLASAPGQMNEYSTAQRNLISTFCFIYQYSEIQNNPAFRKTIENMFRRYHERVYRIHGNRDKFNYDPEKFRRHLNSLRKKVGEILNREGELFVDIKEKDDRIIVTEKESKRSTNYEILDNFVTKPPVDIWDDEFCKLNCNFENCFDELYLITELHPNRVTSRNMLGEKLSFEYSGERKEVCEKAFAQLETMLIELNKLLISNIYQPLMDIKFANEDYWDKIFHKCVIRLHIAQAIAKLKVKYLYGEIEGYNAEDIFSLGSEEYLNDLKALKNILRTSLEKINYYGNGSSELVENLVRYCLVMDV